MRQIIDIDTAKKSTPQVNNAKSTNTKLKLRNKMLFKDAVALPTHSTFFILSHQVSPDSTLKGYNSTGQQVNSNHTLKICLVTIYIAKNDNNGIEVGKAGNALMKVLHDIGGDANKVKIDLRKSKQSDLEVMKYIKDGKYPETKIGIYVYAVRE